jgi:hypothetical protein
MHPITLAYSDYLFRRHLSSAELHRKRLTEDLVRQSPQAVVLFSPDLQALTRNMLARGDVLDALHRNAAEELEFAELKENLLGLYRGLLNDLDAWLEKKFPRDLLEDMARVIDDEGFANANFGVRQ